MYFKGGRKIKPLTLVICATIIAALTISTCGCTASLNTTSSSPTPSATPTTTTPSQSTSPAKLTQDQLTTFENGMVGIGYNVTQHLYYNGTGNDGSLFYNGQLSKAGLTYDYYIQVCKDKQTADSALTLAVSNLQKVGYSGSYSDSQTWVGSMMSNGTAYAAGATASTDNAPYVVMVFFVE